MILQPQAYFTIVRQIANHTDSGTYYVRAVIRNAFSDEIIDTLDLVDKGSQRFKKDWRAPADTSGQGFYISIVTSVYSDSGYTTKSENYGDEENTYLVQERVLNLGGGGGVSAFDVRRIIQEELAKLPKVEKVTIPAPVKYEIHLTEVLEAIRAINIPQPEKVNLEPVISRLNEAIKTIQDKEVTPGTDLTPILTKLNQDKEYNDISIEEVRALLLALEANIEKLIKDNMRDALTNTEFTSSIKMDAKPRDGANAQPKAFNIKQLAL